MNSSTVGTAKTPHQVLGLIPAAEPEVIQGAYKALAMKYHPDRNPSGIERMKAINAAYEVINDPARRREWEMGQGRADAEARDNAGRKEPTSSWTSAPPPKTKPNSQTSPCKYHPYCPEHGQCSGCGATMCKFCRGWKRRIITGPTCLDCRAGQLEARLAAFSVTLVGGSLTWGLLSHGHFGSGLLLSYPIAALPTGLRLWNRVAASPHGQRLSVRLKTLKLTPQQRWLLKGLRCLVPLITGLILCPMELIATSGLLTLEIYRGGYGISWWRDMPERLRVQMERWRRSFA